MKVHRLFPVILSSLLLIPAATAQQGRFDDIEYKTTELGHGLYMLEATGGNIGLSVGPDGAFLIDDQFAPLTQKLLAAVAAVSDQPVRFVINTHWHGDHVGGNENLANAGALIFAHDNVRARMAAPGPRQSPAKALPVITFSDATTYHLNGLTIRAFHVANAHTDGDAIIHIAEADLIHAGDILFNGLYPFIDLDSGGSVAGYIAAMERIVEMAGAGTKIIAGHGPLATRADVERSIAMVREGRARVARLVAEGKSLEEIQALDPLADYHAAWSWSFIDGKRFTETLFRDSTR